MSEPLQWQQAASGRSKCRATGEVIDKGEWRVGLEVWTSGRMATAWMKALPFLRSCCRVDYALRAGSTCRATGTKFEAGQPRFVAWAGDESKKLYLSLPAAGAALASALAHVGAEFGATEIAGLAALAAPDRAAFYKAFGVPAAAAAAFDRQHPPPAPPSFEKGKAGSGEKKGRAARKAAAAESEEEAEAEQQEGQQASQQQQLEEVGGGAVGEEEDGDGVAQRPAKRARGAAARQGSAASGAGAAAAAAAAEPQGAS